MENKRVLFIGFVWPEPTSSAAGWRILQLVDFFLEQNCDVHFASAAHKSDFSFRFDANKVTEHAIELNNASFDDFVKHLSPDVVVYDRFMIEEQFGWRVRENCKDALQILDTEDLHFVRKAREKAFMKQTSINYYTDDAIREMASIMRCDLSLIISEIEMSLLESEFNIPSQILLYLPFLEKPSENVSMLPTFHERNHFMFIGNFMHEPNWQTVLKLKKEIWPILSKKLPKAELHIFGAYPNPKALQLHKPAEHFFVNGRAKDVNEEMRKFKVLLAPIPFGAGIKGKFIDAMKNGLPSVTTITGSESMEGDGLWNGFIASTNDQFIENAILLSEDVNVWNKSVETGFNILETSSNREYFSDKFKQKLSTIFIDLKKHRKSNFFGEILRFQTNQATKFMSMWIQEKNKN